MPEQRSVAPRALARLSLPVAGWLCTIALAFGILAGFVYQTWAG
jgi:hypothetical protein